MGKFEKSLPTPNASPERRRTLSTQKMKYGDESERISHKIESPKKQLPVMELH